jgi:hypothetical protein
VIGLLSPSIPPLSLPPSEGTDGAGILVEQARMMVQGEEARFTATQSRATTLLAVCGVLAGIGATVALHFDGRHFTPIAVMIVGALTLIAVTSLASASIIALGAMRQEIELNMHPMLVTALIAEQFPRLLGESEDQAAKTVLRLLAELHAGAQEANAAINVALWRCGVFLGTAVSTGLVLSAFILVASSPMPHKVHVIENHERVIPVAVT